MDITRTFYDSLASPYDKLFLDWVEPPVSRQGYWKKYFPIMPVKISPDSVKITYGSFTISWRMVDFFWN